jgi:hypothetical protein
MNEVLEKRKNDSSNPHWQDKLHDSLLFQILGVELVDVMVSGH